MAEQKPTPLTDQELEAALGQHVLIADQYGDEVQDKREDLHRRYMGEPYGDEDPDLSQVVSTDISDTIEWMMPSLIEIFAGAEETVRFEPVSAEDEPAAEQETAVISHEFFNRNHGFLVFHEWFKDALLAKNGVVKYWWQERETVEVEQYQALTDDGLAQVIAELREKIGDDGEELPEGDRFEGEKGYFTIEEQESEEVEPAIVDPMTGVVMQEAIYEHSIKARLRYTHGRVKVAAVPPEDFILTPRHTSVFLDDVEFCAHRVRSTVGDLLAEGYDFERVRRLETDDRSFESDGVRDARHSADTGSDADDTAYAGEAMRPVVYYECYIRADRDGDGIPERLKVSFGGNEFLTKDGEPDIEEWQGPPPFAALTPIIMSHKFYGRSVAELVEDLQRIKTVLMRQLLDNIYATQNPTTEIPEPAIGDNTIDDFLTVRAGGKIVRTRQPGLMREVAIPPVAPALLGVIEYVDTLRENRSGVTRYNQGLDAQSLNKTKGGIDRIMNASQQKIQLIARVFAETGIRALFRGMHKTMTHFARRELSLKLRNKWVDVDPRHWRERTDMTVNVGLGMGSKDQRVGHLMNILQIQREARLAGSPLVDDGKIYNTLEKLVEAVGLKSAEPYFTDPRDENGEVMQSPAQNVDPATAAMAAAEQAKMQIEVQKLQLDVRKQEQEMARAVSEDDRKRDEHETELLLKVREAQAKGVPVTDDEVWALLTRPRGPQAAPQPAPGVAPNGSGVV